MTTKEVMANHIDLVRETQTDDSSDVFLTCKMTIVAVSFKKEIGFSIF